MAGDDEGELGEDSTADLQELPRQPMRFDVLNTFSQYSETGELSVTDPATIQRFFAEARDSLEGELQKRTSLSGHIAEGMFAGLVVSLGKVQLIKEEDQGRTWYLDNVLVPDFLVVLRDGRQLLVEVKSHFQEPPMEEFTISPGAWTDCSGTQLWSEPSSISRSTWCVGTCGCLFRRRHSSRAKGKASDRV